MRKWLTCLVALLAISGCWVGDHARALASDFSAGQNPVTVREWLRTHPGNVFLDANQVADSPTVQSNHLAQTATFCGIASTSGPITGASEVKAYFRVPDPKSLQLPASDTPESELLKQCVLSGATAENVSGGSSRDLSNENDTVDIVMRDLGRAGTIAEASGLPGALVYQMRDVVHEVEEWQQGHRPLASIDLQQIASFLVQWVTTARQVTPAERAAALYAADVLLGWLYIPADLDRVSRHEVNQNVVHIKEQLTAAGAQFTYNELGASYSYQHDWVQEAFRTAPDSRGGKAAFLYILDAAFTPGGCPGDGFEDVITRAPNYLRQYSDPEIRAHIFLALGDAYRDRIAVANGANGDPSQEAAQYKPQVQQNYAEALHLYRQAISASPGSDSAQKALVSAWALIAGLKPLDTRFVCVGD